ncbi:hypothetical protein FQR65_LT17569 [Abscondita terminalis]|nr:hypothetical protein FQR65_LT17569 [Abscondita terminalis]
MTCRIVRVCQDVPNVSMTVSAKERGHVDLVFNIIVIVMIGFQVTINDTVWIQVAADRDLSNSGICSLGLKLNHERFSLQSTGYIYSFQKESRRGSNMSLLSQNLMNQGKNYDRNKFRRKDPILKQYCLVEENHGEVQKEEFRKTGSYTEGKESFQ